MTRPSAGPGVGPVGIADQPAETNPPLRCRPALQNVNAPIPQLLADSILHVGGELTPQVSSVPQLDFSVMHP